MPVRPNLDPETVEELNEKVQDVVRVDAESVSVDERIKILLGEMDNLTEEVEEKEKLNQELTNIHTTLQNIKNSVRNQRSGL